jgi:hypothetical protein
MNLISHLQPDQQSEDAMKIHHAMRRIRWPVDHPS